MLLPFGCGRCYCHSIASLSVLMADGIAKMSLMFCNHQCWYIQYGRCYSQLADGIATLDWNVGWCYCHVADGIATGSVHFNLSSEVLNRTSSHMWGRWHLPMFLFRDELLTLMYKASLMGLMKFCSSLPTMRKFSIETWWPVVLKWSKIGEGALRCSLNLSPNVLNDSPMYSSLHSTLSHLNL